MASSKKMNAFDRYNILLPLIGYLMRNQETKISQVAAHFGVTEQFVREALSTLMATATFEDRVFERAYYMFDVEKLDGEGVISLWQGEAIEDTPRLSARQASALAAGLSIMSSLPEFTDEREIAELLEIISNGSTDTGPAAIHYKPAPIDADAAVIRKAMLNNHRIECVYRNNRGITSTRQIDPLRLDPRDNIWFLRGYCLTNNELRSFRLDHMGSARELDIEISEAAAQIKEIDDADYLSNETDIAVTVEVDPEAYSMLGDFSAEILHENKKTNVVTAVIKVGFLPYLGKVIARHGGAARVLEPESAKQVVRNYALGALGLEPENLPEED